jgi:tetratricopeptide (TPR) repeat protein
LIFQVTDTPRTESQTRRSQELWTVCDLQPQDPADEVTLEFFLERHLLLAQYYRERGAAEAVIRECQRSLDLARAHPQRPPPAKLLAQAHLWLGLIDRERNDLTAATQHYEQAVSLQPRNVELRNSLAVLYTQQGDLPRALAQWEAALRVDPDNPSLRRNRQRARAALGKDSAPP